MPKAYSYMRFSTPEQAKGDSKRRQAQQAEEYAVANGLELDDKLTYRDYGVSAFRGANVEIGKLGQFMEAIRRQEVKAGSFLLVESLDRISRDVILPAQNIFTQIIMEGVTIVTLSDKRVYSVELMNKSPFLLIEAIIILIRANDESETKSMRLKAVWENRRENISTTPLTSTGPGWLKFNKETKKFEVIPERGIIVSRMFQEHLEGKGCSAIARGLRQENIATWTHKRGEASIWREHYIWKILNSAAVIGTLIPHKMDHSDGKKRVPLAEVRGYYPAVISEEIFCRVQEMRFNFKRVGKAPVTIKNVFSMIGRCAQCGSRQMYANKGRFFSYLACTNANYGQGCKIKAIPYPRLEVVFLSEFANALSMFPPANPEIRRVHSELVEIRTHIKVAEAEQVRLLEYVKFDIEHDKFEAIRTTCDEFDRLDQTLAECQQVLNSLTVQPKDLTRQQIDHLTKKFSEESKCVDLNRGSVNSIIRSLCDSILISLGRIEVTFKVGPKLCIEYGKEWSKFAYIQANYGDGD